MLAVDRAADLYTQRLATKTARHLDPAEVITYGLEDILTEGF